MAFTKANSTKAGPGQLAATTRNDLAVWIDATGKLVSGAANEMLRHRNLQDAGVIRVGNQYKGRRNYQGLYYFSRSAQHVWHESLFEKTALTWLDFRYDIVKIAAQPMMLQFTSGAIHYPDFFALHADGRQVLYDVRPEHLIKDKTRVQFGATKAFCAKVGWDYQVFTGISPVAKANLEWIAGFRANRYRPSDHDATTIAAAATTPMPFNDLVDFVNPFDRGRGASIIYSMIWDHRLRFDLESPFNSSTPIWSDVHGAH